MNRSFIFTEYPEKGSKKSWQLNYSKTFIKKGFALFITSSGCYDFAWIFTQLQIIFTNTPSMMLGEQHNSFFSNSLFIRLGIWDKWNNFLLLKKYPSFEKALPFFYVISLFVLLHYVTFTEQLSRNPWFLVSYFSLILLFPWWLQ